MLANARLCIATQLFYSSLTPFDRTNVRRNSLKSPNT